MPDRPTVDEHLELVLREERGRLTAALVRILRDWDLAEELVQEAAIAALEHWPRSGIPARPGAWLMTAARRKAVDLVRREARYRDRMPALTAAATEREEPMPTSGAAAFDDRLSLLFTCCHPALSREAQIALTLRTIGGLETAAIARAFLVPEPTIAQRLVRAKRKIRDAGIPYRVPDASELPARLGEVLTVLYLVFNEGYLASGSASPERRELARDAEWLTSLVHRLMPDEPEVIGLLALMRLHLARADGRFAADGTLVRLADQDRGRWDRGAIDAALSLIERGQRMAHTGPYMIQAAIAAAHAAAPSWAETPWRVILDLYDLLLRHHGTPVVALNRAVALAEVHGPEAALAVVDALAADLDGYHLFHAVRGDFLGRLGRPAEAATANRRALDLTSNPAERDLLERRSAAP